MSATIKIESSTKITVSNILLADNTSPTTITSVTAEVKDSDGDLVGTTLVLVETPPASGTYVGTLAALSLTEGNYYTIDVIVIADGLQLKKRSKFLAEYEVLDG